jgi:hypothetical protein
MMLEGKYVSPSNQLRNALIAKSLHPMQQALHTDEYHFKSPESIQRLEIKD